MAKIVVSVLPAKLPSLSPIRAKAFLAFEAEESLCEKFAATAKS
jgi:hypothetical protein